MDNTSRHPLNDGRSIPYLGLGLYQTEAGRVAERVIEEALLAGYRHLDTASIYRNESSVARAIKMSGIPREQIYVTTKLWNDDHGPNARKAFEKSLLRLGLDYVDLYLIHWPVGGQRLETWRTLEALFRDGLARSIGVSNYLAPHLEELLAGCHIPPAVDQIELHPYNYAYRGPTIELCRAHQIAVEAYSPLTQGVKLEDPPLVRIAEKYGKSTAQVLIRWSLQHELIPLPKSSKPERVRENFDVFDFEIGAADMKTLDALDQKLVVCWDPTGAP